MSPTFGWFPYMTDKETKAQNGQMQSVELHPELWPLLPGSLPFSPTVMFALWSVKNGRRCLPTGACWPVDAIFSNDFWAQSQVLGCLAPWC